MAYPTSDAVTEALDGCEKRAYIRVVTLSGNMEGWDREACGWDHAKQLVEDAEAGVMGEGSEEWRKTTRASSAS